VRRRKLFLLGVTEEGRLGGRVQFAQVTSETVWVDVSGYPQWLVVLVGTFVAVLIIWILMKLLKWTLWLLMFGVLIGGVVWSGWLLVN
jgi:hypothetical protein